MKNIYSLNKPIAFLLSITVLVESVFPIHSFAISNPQASEFSTFESASTTNMVNEFNGAFTYNLPLFAIPSSEGFSYPISLSYHSGITPEEDASWVGLGWTLNPGAINRSKRGFPDEYKGAEVTYYNKKPKNKTTSLQLNAGIEAFSKDNDEAGLSVNIGGIDLQAAIRFNNYRGIGYSFGAGISPLGIASLNYAKTDGQRSFSANINPAGILSVVNTNSGEFYNTGNSLGKQTLLQNSNQFKSRFIGSVVSGTWGTLGKFNYYSHSNEIYPTNSIEYESKTYTGKISVQTNPMGFPIGLEAGLTGTSTWQEPKESSNKNTYGYMYLGASSNVEDILDYGVERDMGYNKSDYYLPIPVLNYDEFTMSGEGSIGGFRLYNRGIGILRPNEVENKSTVFSIGAEVSLGMNFGGGMNVETGKQTLFVGKWNPYDCLSDFKFAADADEAVFFKANGDLGGAMEYASTENAEAPTIEWTEDASTGNWYYAPQMPSTIFKTLNENKDAFDQRTGRSSYIAYHTIKDLDRTSSLASYYAYCKDADATAFMDYSTSSIADGIGEMAVTNASGISYIYGLPVYARNEGNMQYGLDDFDDGYGTLVDDIIDNRIVDMNASFSPETPGVRMGTYSGTPYASSFLLTAVTSKDYIDKSFDGPSDDDFGAWVKFSYDRAYGSNDKTSTSANWYNWRFPYTGLQYEKNELSDLKDDVGAVSFGQREVYYIKSIESKTHIAEFITSNREDALDAYETTTASDEAAKDLNLQGGDTLKKLDKIEVYTKDASGNKLKKIQVIHFEYDYSLCKNIPNNTGNPVDKYGNSVSESSTANVNKNKGKLTLTKLWIEYYENDRRISPYEFIYTYKTESEYQSEVKDLYTDIINYGSGLEENPEYNIAHADPWGYHAETALNNIIKTLDQTPSNTFDPAAWHLKQIKLPTGGEIVVQYEQHSYSYVQDKRAMVLAKLKDTSTDADDSSNNYYIDLESIGIETDEDKQYIVKLIKEEVQKNKKLYYKFLYSLTSDAVDINSCSSEYIDGWATIEDVVLTAGGEIYITLKESGGYWAPKQVCWDYTEIQKGGEGNVTSDCSLPEDLSGSNADDLVYSLLGILDDIYTGEKTFFDKDNSCQSIDFSNSYFKIPIGIEKKGGGVRVKRLLSYDDGIESGDAVLYGNEYIYETQDDYGYTISSGVATNEPTTMRHENALVNLLDRAKQSSIDKIIAGEDKRQQEGPIGELFLSTPSVGYSKVTVKNIYQGDGAPAYTVNEFYTDKDFPYDADVTDINMKHDEDQMQGLFNTSYDTDYWLSQGYAFHFYNMHGKPKLISTCIDNSGETILLSSQQFTYYDKDDEISFIDESDYNSYSAKIPRELDVIIESRNIEDKFKNASLEIDATIGIFILPPPIFVACFPIAIVFPTTLEQESTLSYAVINKVIQHIPVLKETKTIENGIEYYSTNIGFNAQNGQVLLASTSSEFNSGLSADGNNYDGNYYSYNFAASHQYSELGQKASNEQLELNSGTDGVTINKLVSSSEIYLEFISTDADIDLCNYIKLFPGDLIQLDETGSYQNLYYVGEKKANKIQLFPVVKAAVNPALWASAYSNVSLKVLSSGRENALSASVGNFTSYGIEPTITSNQTLDPLREALVAELNSKLLSSNSFTINLKTKYPNLEVKTGISSSGNCTSDKISNLPNYEYVSVDFSESVYGANAGVLCLKPSGFNGCKCETELYIASASAGYSSPGTFEIDPNSGNIVFVSSDLSCEMQLVSCLESCDFNPTTYSSQNIISSSANTISDDWTFNTTIHTISTSASYGFTPSGYENGQKGSFKPYTSHVYKTSVSGIDGTSTTARNNNSGIYDDFIFYNWKNEEANEQSNWVKTNTIEKYNPYNIAVQDYNLLGTYSCSKIGYNQNFPYLAAHNAQEGEVQFESFENSYTYSGIAYYEDLLKAWKGSRYSTYAHTGKYCLKVNNGSFASTYTSGSPYVVNLNLNALKLTRNIASNGLLIRLWVKQLPETANSTTYWDITNFLKLNLISGSTTLTYQFKEVAKTGDWSLIECKVNNVGTIIMGSNITPRIVYTWYSGQGKINVLLDDVSLQPLNSQMNCYVYDLEKFYLKAVLDDQHFATYYQYNDEGKLMNVRKETQNGVKTINEQSNHIISECH